MKTVTIKFGSVDNATSFVKAIEDFESHFDLIYGQYVVDAKSLLGVMTMDIRNKVDLRIMERENEMPTIMASLSKLKDVYRQVLYLKHKEEERLLDLKRRLEPVLEKHPMFAGISIQFDFDPLSHY